MLQNLQREKSTILKAKVLKSDFKRIRTIAKNTKCRVHIEKKIGIPFIINKYRKRKIFAIALGVIAIFIGIADIKDKKEAKKEEEASKKNLDIK